MPVNKNALQRYIIIDRCIRDGTNRFPARDYLVRKVSEILGEQVSDSTIDKDIKGLKEEHGAPIKYNREKNGYYYSDDNYSFRNSFSDEDLWIMDFATAAMRVLGDERMNKKFKGISKRMAKGAAEKDEEDPDFINYISIEGSAVKKGYEWLFELYMHIINNKTVSLVYAPFGREKKRHIISPYLLKQDKNRWYLLGHSHSISSTITLALDRIERMEPAREKYYHDRFFNKQEYLQHAYGVFHNRESGVEKVRLRFSNTIKPYILSDPLHRTQQIIEDNKSGLLIEIKIYAKGNPDFLSKLLSYGEDVTVISPDYIRQEVIKRANGIVKKYE